ncbi:uncharacterized protein A4U43_C03F2380 [Asparagus officinalis]|uniref:Neprosin PEP catalytic domain-containing protein n=1 Tax=Asparagus officinalis TaxID=4686 RepID=A0A5P1FBP9_ASPOF|nr:uncharacterized protein A4U43_C03F2380 [Asparagus officinalis]
MYGQCVPHHYQGSLAQNEAFLKKGFGEKVSERNPLVFDPSLGDRITHKAEYSSGEGKWGSQAEIIVYGLPQVQNDDITAAFISVASGSSPDEDFNLLVAGWHVSPKLYGDTDTHFFTYWTADENRKTGCFNLLCEGFVTYNASRYPGIRIWPLSKYNGKQYAVPVAIHQDERSGDWLLYVQGIILGHWPKTLFTSLSNGADEINWGGNVNFDKNKKSPPMGQRPLPDEGFGKRRHSRVVQFVDQHGQPYDPNPDEVGPIVDRDDCYAVGDFSRSETTGFTFYFGGPGGCSG